MQRTLVNFWLDVSLLVLLLLLAWVSCVVKFAFPQGPLAAGYSLWGFAYADWADLQFGLVAALVLAVLLHVMLHWSWVCGVVAVRLAPAREGKRKVDEGAQTLYGVGLLILLLNLLGLGLAAAVLMVRGPA